MSKLNPFTPLPKQEKQQLTMSLAGRKINTWAKKGLKVLEHLKVLK